MGSSHQCWTFRSPRICKAQNKRVHVTYMYGLLRNARVEAQAHLLYWSTICSPSATHPSASTTRYAQKHANTLVQFHIIRHRWPGRSYERLAYLTVPGSSAFLRESLHLNLPLKLLVAVVLHASRARTIPAHIVAIASRWGPRLPLRVPRRHFRLGDHISRLNEVCMTGRTTQREFNIWVNVEPTPYCSTTIGIKCPTHPAQGPP